MKIEITPKLDFHNVLIKPQRTTISSRNEVSLEREFNFPHSKSVWRGVPIMAANMDTTGTFEIANILSQHGMLTCLNKFYTLNDYKRYLSNEEKMTLENKNNLLNHIVVSTGIGERDFVNLCGIMDNIEGLKWICIDVANGYMERMTKFCAKVREKYPKAIIIAGNVATSEMTQELIINGKVDIVKVGIGPGSACLTRLKTGVGVPQLSAIIDCADAAHGCSGYIIGDGGITCPGDMAKAFGGGADFVMCGGVFSGHDENPGDLISEIVNLPSGVEKEVKYKMFYGMSSELAMTKHYGKMAKYRSSEGREIKVKYRGPLEKTVLDYLGGLRSTCAYVNAYKIKHLPKCTTFILTSQQLNRHLVK
jgi:GMP reductase